jgi:outer membrane protein
MNTIYRKLLILLLVCSLPTLAIAAESTTGDQKTSPPAQPAIAIAAPVVTPPMVTATPQMTPDAFKPQPSILIGYVDLALVSTESEIGKAGQAKLTEKKKKLQTQIETKRKQLDKQRAEIEAKLPTLTPEQRESKAKDFQKKVNQYQIFIQKADKELQELQQELSRILFEKIERAASEYGKSNSLVLVTVKRDLIYIASNVVSRDVTEGVVKLINKNGENK